MDGGVGVAVSEDRQVEVVGGRSAGEHCVQLLVWSATGDEAVHGVGGDALGGVDGGRIAEFDGRPDVVGWQGGNRAGAEVFHAELTLSGDVVNGPTVAVLDPVAAAGAEPPVLAAGDDDVTGAGARPARLRRSSSKSGK